MILLHLSEHAFLFLHFWINVNFKILYYFLNFTIIHVHVTKIVMRLTTVLAFAFA